MQRSLSYFRIQQLTTKQQDIQKQINHLKDDIGKQDQVIRVNDAF